GVAQRAEHAVAVQPQRGLVRRDELAERVPVPALRPVDQVGGHAGMLAPTSGRDRCLSPRSLVTRPPISRGNEGAHMTTIPAVEVTLPSRRRPPRSTAT